MGWALGADYGWVPYSVKLCGCNDRTLSTVPVGLEQKELECTEIYKLQQTVVAKLAVTE